jgi:hypothetical protein
MNCAQCNRCRPKREEHLAAEGYVECKATRDSTLLLAAFNEYATNRRSTAIFVVEGVAQHPGSAWPFQFQPDSIASCAGFDGEPRAA